MRATHILILLAGAAVAGVAAAPVAVVPTATIAAAQASGRTQEITLVAEPVRWEIQPGLVVDGWGYNGGTPGPTIRATEGDRVRITLINRLPVPTTIHWHGIDVPPDQDGVPGLSQDAVEPGESFVYDFIVTNPGTRWYHSHVDSNTQIQMGLFGAFIVDPRVPEPMTYDREFIYFLTEKALDFTPAVALGQADVRNRATGNGRGGAFQPDLFLMNGKAGTAIEPATIGRGERVRIRLINAGNMEHAMHTHGHSFKIVATDGNPVPPAAQLLKDTVLIGSSERYDIEVEGTNPGVWMFHCHINNHAANGMVTELRYDGAQPLAGGDHSIAHGPATAPPATAAAAAAPMAQPAAHSGHAAATGIPPAVTPTPTPTPPPAATSAPSMPGPDDATMERGQTAPLANTSFSAGDTPVMMMDDRFTPGRLSVKPGTTVTWMHSGNNLHTTTALDGSWDSGSLERGQSFSFTFATPGTYQFICRQHLLQGMRGTVTVESP
jgi:FtsP/CotA-like multicopper oxidase with cupredoxin domain